MEITLNRSLGFKGPNIGIRTLQLGGGGAWKWDVSTLTPSGTFNAAANGGLATQGGLEFDPTGTVMICGDNAADGLRQWILSTPWDITTATYDTFKAWNNSYCTGLCIEEGVTVLNAQVVNQIYKHTLNTPWDINGGVVYSQVKNIGRVAGELNCNADGTVIITPERSTANVMQLGMSTPWDVSTLTVDDTQALVAGATSGAGYVSNDGLHFIAGESTTIRDYTLASEYTIAGLTHTNTGSVSFSPLAMYINEELGYLYTLDTGEIVRRYTMSEL